MKDFKELREKQKIEYSPNPWAVCTKSVGRTNKDKYERCVKKVKKKATKKKTFKESRSYYNAFLEENFEDTYGYRSSWVYFIGLGRHAKMYLPISTRVNQLVFNKDSKLYVEAWHVFGLKYINTFANNQNKKRVPISCYMQIPQKAAAWSGIEAGGGFIGLIEGNCLFESNTDAWTNTDDSGRRWISTESIVYSFDSFKRNIMSLKRGQALKGHVDVTSPDYVGLQKYVKNMNKIVHRVKVKIVQKYILTDQFYSKLIEHSDTHLRDAYRKTLDHQVDNFSQSMAIFVNPQRNILTNDTEKKKYLSEVFNRVLKTDIGSFLFFISHMSEVLITSKTKELCIKNYVQDITSAMKKYEHLLRQAYYPFTELFSKSNRNEFILSEHTNITEWILTDYRIKSVAIICKGFISSILEETDKSAFIKLLTEKNYMKRSQIVRDLIRKHPNVNFFKTDDPYLDAMKEAMKTYPKHEFFVPMSVLDTDNRSVNDVKNSTKDSEWYSFVKDFYKKYGN